MLNNQRKNNLLNDSRTNNYNIDNLWDKLNLSQQYAVCSLGQFGYLLAYVRTIGEKTLAILKQNNKVATINESGGINVNPTINFRL